MAKGLGLAGCDVDLEKGRLTIRQALHRVDGELLLEQVKTEASVAVLPAPAPLVSILRRAPQSTARRALQAGARSRDTGLVFTTASGGFLELRNINRVFHSLCARARDRPADSAPQFDHGDDRHLRRGDRGGAA